MSSLQPSPRQRQFLRGIAAVNPGAKTGEECWWSVYDLQNTPLFPDFRMISTLSLAALARSCDAKGFTETRHIGSLGSGGWSEFRIRALGRGLVADSCIGSGLKWTPAGTCPACLIRAADMNVPPAGWLPAEIPAHPLPGYLPEARDVKPR